MNLKDLIVDFGNPKESAMMLNVIRGLHGRRRVSIIDYRPRRSDRQNRYYWPCFVQPFAEFLREQGQEILDDEAHELFKAKFLRRPMFDPATGNVCGFAIRSTTTLTTVEFNDYLDRCALWLADMFGIIVPDPSIYHERDEAA